MRPSAHIGFLGCKYTTRECIEALHRSGWRVDCLVTIDPQIAASNQVAGFEDLRSFAAGQGIPLRLAERYDLKSDGDSEFFSDAAFDVLLVIGWERLVPDLVLQTLKCGAFGMHGSPRGLPKGRGRSPLNWSLILGETKFQTSLFRYRPGVDDGDVVASVDFDITTFDTCHTLHFKNRMAMNALLDEHLAGILAGTATYHPQPRDTPTFFPRRRAEDGGIDWFHNAERVHGFVRALTRPYPGAFTFFGPTRLAIWAGHPFGRFPRAGQPGLVREVFSNGSFLVDCADQTYLVTDYDAAAGFSLVPGSVLTSVSWEETLRKIVTRYPAGISESQWEVTPEMFERKAAES